MVGSTWVFVGKCLCTRRKVTQPKAANQLSQITQDRERDLPPRWETNPTLLQAASCFQAACFPSFSLSVWSVLLLCLIQLLLLETALCVPPEFFPSRAQEQGNHHSASNSTSVKEYAVAGGQEEIRKLGVGQITSYRTGKESQIQAHRKIRPKGQHSEHCDGNLPLGQIRNLGVHGLESHLSLALPGQRGDQILGRVCG